MSLIGIMTASDISQSALHSPEPPAQLSEEAKSLWYARAGNWDAAHDLCQAIPGKAGAWIHAWLHRQEGDLGNAGYWYARAGKALPPKSLSLDEEWMIIAKELLD